MTLIKISIKINLIPEHVLFLFILVTSHIGLGLTTGVKNLLLQWHLVLQSWKAL